eukprot:363403-Chlamydomonas_euryale.AAC.24
MRRVAWRVGKGGTASERGTLLHPPSHFPPRSDGGRRGVGEWARLAGCSIYAAPWPGAPPPLHGCEPRAPPSLSPPLSAATLRYPGDCPFGCALVNGHVPDMHGTAPHGQSRSKAQGHPLCVMQHMQLSLCQLSGSDWINLLITGHKNHKASKGGKERAKRTGKGHNCRRAT